MFILLCIAFSKQCFNFFLLKEPIYDSANIFDHLLCAQYCPLFWKNTGSHPGPAHKLVQERNTNISNRTGLGISNSGCLKRSEVPENTSLSLIVKMWFPLSCLQYLLVKEITFFGCLVCARHRETL